MTSDLLYASSPQKPVAKKMTNRKIAEIGGSEAVRGLDMNQMLSQSLCKTRTVRTQAVEGVLGSKGASEAIGGYRDNDITANLVNTKHTNPAVMNPGKEARMTKASSKVNWNQPKGR